MPRRNEFAIARLSPEGLAVVHRGLRENWTYLRIVAEVKQATGETIYRGSLSRYDKTNREQSAALREMQDQAAVFTAEIRAGNMSVSDVANALIARALFEGREGLRKANPIYLSREQREREKTEIKKQELALKARQVEVTERKLVALEAKQKAIEEKIGKAVAPESTELTEAQKAKIRSIYGIEE